MQIALPDPILNLLIQDQKGTLLRPADDAVRLPLHDAEAAPIPGHLHLPGGVQVSSANPCHRHLPHQGTKDQTGAAVNRRHHIAVEMVGTTVVPHLLPTVGNGNIRPPRRGRGRGMYARGRLRLSKRNLGTTDMANGGMILGIGTGIGIGGRHPRLGGTSRHTGGGRTREIGVMIEEGERRKYLTSFMLCYFYFFILNFFRESRA